tara:strand:+ start:22 stop:357 length:336 start_codon:yes stop_codon:yes gene_type:complete
MAKWSDQIENELTLLIKDWLKAQGRTQADLRKSLDAVSTRMPSLVDELKKEYLQGGLPKIASRLCNIEERWRSNQSLNTYKEVEENHQSKSIDPFGQLDLLLEEIREDCES